MLRTIFRLVPVAIFAGSVALSQQTPPAPDAPGAYPPHPSAPAPSRASGPNPRTDMMRDRALHVQDAMDHVRDIQLFAPNGMRGDSRIAPPGMWWKNPDLVTKLNLSADQQKRMDEIFLQFRIKLIHMKASLEEQELVLEPMVNANPPDANKAMAQISKIADTRADLEKANAAMLLGVRGVLTPDQWTKLQAEDKNRRHVTIGALDPTNDTGFDLAMLDRTEMPDAFTFDIPDIQGTVQEALSNLDLKSLQTMQIEIPKIDMTGLQRSIDSIKNEIPKIDLKGLEKSLDSIQPTLDPQSVVPSAGSAEDTSHP